MPASIRKEFLKELTPELSAMTADLLERILVEHATYKTATETEIQLIANVVQAMPGCPIKSSILDAIQGEALCQLIPLVSGSEQAGIFELHADFKTLVVYFKSLDDAAQTPILQRLYSSNRWRYQQLKTLSNRRIKMVSGILIKEEKILAKFLEREVAEALDKIQGADRNAVSAYAAQLAQKYEADDLEAMAIQTIEGFLKTKTPLTSPAQFSVHQRFYLFIDPFIHLSVEIGTALRPALDQLILTMSSMPDTTWRLKVLNQIPISTIRVILGRLKGAEQQSSLERRTLYNKLFRELTESPEMTSYANVVMALANL